MAPTALFVRGERAALERLSVGIVGTRRASPQGKKNAFRFARALAVRGIAVVSGLARGVDAMAHWGCLKGKSPTVAVLAHGLDRIYPAEHRGLAAAIVEAGGCLVSEFPPSVPPLKHHFPLRNRLIAGLSRGTVVIEAQIKSGALITANYAADYGREVFVLPGDAEDVAYSGNHKLIQEGAHLVTSPREILKELFPELELGRREAAPVSPFLDLFGDSARSLPELLSRVGEARASFLAWLEQALERGDIVEIGYQQFARVSVE